MWHISLCLLTIHQISFLGNRFRFKYRFPFQIRRFSITKSPSVTQIKIGISRECFHKEQKILSPFSQNYTLKWFFFIHQISFLGNRFRFKYRFPFQIRRFSITKSPSVTRWFWNQFQIFQIAKFEFRVRVHYGLWEKKKKKKQLWPLNLYWETK